MGWGWPDCFGKLYRLQNCAIRLINDISVTDDTGIFMVVARGSFMIWFRLYYHARVSLEDWMVHNGLVFHKSYVEHIDKNSLIFQQPIFWNCYQPIVFQKITKWICLRGDFTPTLLLDVIGGLLNMISSPNLLIYFLI